MILRNNPSSPSMGVGIIIGALGAIICHQHWMLEPPVDPDPDPYDGWTIASRNHYPSVMKMTAALLLAMAAIFLAIDGMRYTDTANNSSISNINTDTNPSTKDARPLNKNNKNRGLLLPLGFADGGATDAASYLCELFCNVSRAGVLCCLLLLSQATRELLASFLDNLVSGFTGAGWQYCIVLLGFSF